MNRGRIIEKRIIKVSTVAIGEKKSTDSLGLVVFRILLRVERLARVFRMVQKQLTRVELLLAIGYRETIHVIDDLVGAVQIDESERAYTENRFSKTRSNFF